MPGFDTYALAKGARDGRARGRRRQQMLQQNRPTEFFTDRRRHPLDPPTTTDLGKALTWRSRQGPYEFLKRRPTLKGKFYPCPVERPVTRRSA